MHVRFHAPDATAPGETVALPPEESAHLTRVLRLKAGDAVRIFNGRGGEFEGTIEHLARGGVRVRVGVPLVAVAESRLALTLAPAVLKGDKMDEVIRDAVMLGIAAVQPVIAGRSEVSLAALARGGRRARWERIAIASAKQCGRAVVPAILPPCHFDTVVHDIAAGGRPGPGLMFVEPGASADAVRVGDLPGEPPREATILVGPEGGWTPEELTAAAAACRLVTLRSPILRADAVPIVAIAALFTRWGEW